MKRIFIGMLTLALLFAGSVQADDNARWHKGNTPWLKSHIYYYLAVDQGLFNSQGWLLAWEGTIHGDVNGVIRYWVDLTEGDPPDYVTRWEVLNCAPVNPIACPHDPNLVILAGYSAGTNLAPHGGFQKWLGKGIVTFADSDSGYQKWFGRRTTEGGWYDLDDVPDGWGTFMIYGKRSNRH